MTVVQGTVERFPQAEFINNYGSTEGGPVTTFLAAEDSAAQVRLGRPRVVTACRSASSARTARNSAPARSANSSVRSPFMSPGYFNRPAETAAQLRDGWWFTGDLAWRDDEGFLWIAGRSKDMVKTGTENVYPIEVEQVIVAIEGVVEVGVIGVPDEHWGESVVAFVVKEPGSPLDAAQVIEHCRTHLAGYKKPRHVRFIDSLPRGTTNKVAKNVLRELWAKGANSQEGL